jgi:hypothetical protein
MYKKSTEHKTSPIGMLYQQQAICKIRGFHSIISEDSNLLGYDAQLLSE